MASLLTSKYRLGKRLVQSWFQDVYKMPICLGSVSNVEGTVSQSLKPVHEEVLAAMQREKIVHVDETGHKECNKNGWAWITSVPAYTCFVLNRSRGKTVAKEIIGDYQGLWHFFEDPNIPPTNNHTERQLRPLVISKKLTFGTPSDRGSRFIERIFTVITSWRQQGQDVLLLLRQHFRNIFWIKESRL